MAPEMINTSSICKNDVGIKLENHRIHPFYYGPEPKAMDTKPGVTLIMTIPFEEYVFRVLLHYL